MLARESVRRTVARPAARAGPRRGPVTTVALLQDLGSRAGNAAVASLLAPPVQRRGASDPAARAAELLPAGASPLELATLAMVRRLYGDMAARRIAQWAPQTLSQKQVAAEVAVYVADREARPGRLRWALTVEPVDTTRLGALLAVLVERADLATVGWAWQLAGGDRDRAEAIIAYERRYRSQGANVLALATQALEDAGGDVGAADAEMASLAKYDHDPALRDWAGKQAGVLADEEVEARKATAEATHTAAVEALGPDTPHVGGTKKLAKWKVKENKEAKQKNEKARIDLAAQKDLDVNAALAAGPALAGAARAAMESFLRDSRMVRLAPADSAWILQQAGGRADLAAALRPLFDPGMQDGRAATAWVLERATRAPEAQRLVMGLVEAASDGLDRAAAQAIVGLPAWGTLDVATARALSTAVSAEPAALARTVQWLRSAASLPDAARLLATWHGKSGTLAQFLAVAETTQPDQLAWFVGHIGAAAPAAAVRSLQIALASGVNVGDLERLLTSVSPTEAEGLLDRVLPDKGVIDQRLFAILKKATAAQVTSWIVTHRHEVHHLHRWLIDKGWSAADLDPLIAWAPPTHLPFLLEDDTPATLTPLMASTPAHLYKLRMLALTEGEVSKYHPSLAIVVGADAVKGDWNKGTFADPLHSVVYHYCKHVRAEGLAQSVAQYSADALALWQNHGPGFNWNGGKKIQPVAGGTGGLYTSAGQPYSFWY